MLLLGVRNSPDSGGPALFLFFFLFFAIAPHVYFVYLFVNLIDHLFYAHVLSSAAPQPLLSLSLL